MHGISEYVIILLILLISISILSTFYFFISQTQFNIQSSIQNQTSEIQKQTGSEMKILNILNVGSCSINITLLNSGIYELNNFYVYVNNIPWNNVVLINNLKPGEVGIIKVNLDNSYDGKNVEIKITTPYTMRTARKIVNCSGE
ncbi:MAG: hypothetical protein KQA40_02910 [Candidatus Aenigmarchaeota archaeon]|nr:hypothetical protein [Candidatus Aenigmarchaeota archaeon]